MVCSMRVATLFWGILAFSNALAEDAAPSDPANDPEIQKTLKAMHNASTWFHPDMYGMTLGSQEYAKRQYSEALKHFEFGALYADKFSQLCLGLMYMNGEGTLKDPVTALAWLDLAAERNYPDFVATRDELKKTLTAEQIKQAGVLREELGKRYADAVAKPRMAAQLRLGMMNFTGSRTGFDSGVTQVSEVPCGPALVIGARVVPQIGCGYGEYLAKENWKPELYFAARDREWLPQVKVGPISQPAATPPNTPSNTTDGRH
jgi:hypothetical protein